MKKIIHSMLLMLICTIPSFAEVKWDLGASVNSQNLLVVSQKEYQFNQLEISSDINAGLEHSLDNGMSVGLVSVISSKIKEDYAIGVSPRIIRLCLGYRF